PVRHGAEAAVPGAGVAEQHERRGLVPPALAEVRALRFLADGVEPERLHDAARLHVARAAGGTDLDPRRMAPDGLGPRHAHTAPTCAPADTAASRSYPNRAADAARTTSVTGSRSGGPPSRAIDV